MHLISRKTIGLPVQAYYSADDDQQASSESTKSDPDDECSYTVHKHSHHWYSFYL